MEQNRIGLSSACFYPEETLDAVRHCISLGFRNVEIFMNSFSELEDPYLSRIDALCRETGTKITSIHPFTSSYEYMFFFSSYPKRAKDSAELYRKYFYAAGYLGADFTVFHGDSQKSAFCGMDRYCEVLEMLMETARDEGTELLHESVSTARSGDPAFLAGLRGRLGEKALGEKRLRYVFDLKQAVRGGYDPFAVLDAMGNDAAHVHINDWSHADAHQDSRGGIPGDCRLPYAGDLDLDPVIRRLEEAGYRGRYIIEVYRRNFTDDAEIVRAGEELARRNHH